MPDVDSVEWHYPADENVDVAVTPVSLGDADISPLWSGYFALLGNLQNPNFGTGDLVYIVGLYRLFPGRAKILPIVHIGHVAMMPDEEIPMKNRITGKVVNVRGYLVEAQTLDGLSGSPVFVRYTNPTSLATGRGPVSGYSGFVTLLGLWAGSWDAPGETLRAHLGKDAKVPVGMGIMMPVERISEVLDSDALRKQREQHRAKAAEANAASQDAVPAKSEPPTTADNPSHREDFNRLVGAAAKRRPPDDQTYRGVNDGSCGDGIDSLSRAQWPSSEFT